MIDGDEGNETRDIRPQKQSYKDAWSQVLKKVFAMGFEISPTQPLTTANGNCMFEACGDQMGLSCDFLRALVCSSVQTMVNNNSLTWPYGDELTPSIWAKDMAKDHIFGDAIALQIIR